MFISNNWQGSLIWFYKKKYRYFLKKKTYNIYYRKLKGLADKISKFDMNIAQYGYYQQYSILLNNQPNTVLFVYNQKSTTIKNKNIFNNISYPKIKKTYIFKKKQYKRIKYF